MRQSKRDLPTGPACYRYYHQEKKRAFDMKKMLPQSDYGIGWI